MPELKYLAMDPMGRYTRGSLNAANDIDLEQRLQGMGLELITCREADGGPKLFGAGGVSRQDLINFTFHLEQLTRAGVPLLEGLHDLRDSAESRRLREILSSIIEDLQGGKLLSQALEAYPKVFGPIFVSLIRAGEKTGQLPDVLANLSASIKWQDELIAKTRQLLTYPAFVTVVVTAVIFFLMIYLVPQLVDFIQNMEQRVPLQTRLLIATSNFFVAWWPWLLAAPVVLVVGLRLLIARSELARYRYDDWKLRIWVVGPIWRKIMLARMTDTFAMMYASGIPLLESIDINKAVVDNRVVANALQRAADQIAQGTAISHAFDNTRMFPALVVRMLRVGETTGALDQALRNVSYFFNREVDRGIARLQALIEPTMTLILGAILGWVMLSVMGPIYDIITRLKL